MENSKEVLKIDKKLPGSKRQSCDQFLGKIKVTKLGKPGDRRF
jgi:hypothetical protein